MKTANFSLATTLGRARSPTAVCASPRGLLSMDIARSIAGVTRVANSGGRAAIVRLGAAPIRVLALLESVSVTLIYAGGAEPVSTPCTSQWFSGN